MKNQKKIQITAIIAITYFALTVVATSAAIYEPPVPGWRGNDGTTLQKWFFNDSNSTPLADVDENPFGTPLLDVKSDLHLQSHDGAEGVWSLGSEIDIILPNSPEPNPYKEIWLTLIWKAEDSTLLPTGGPFETDPFLPDMPNIGVAFEGMIYQDQWIEEEFIDAEGWLHTTYIIGLWPNPIKEYISIKGNILVDELCIETICIPEPATIAVLSMGGLLALRKRKKSHNTAK